MDPCSDHHSCIDDALQTAEKVIKSKGLQFTELRRSVLRLIWESHRPAKAYDLLEKIKINDPRAQPPTIYRTLDFLLETGLVHRLHSLNSFVGCSHPNEHCDCYFLICNQCHEISECCQTELKHALAETARHQHFTPQNITLEIEGICKKCSS